MNKLIVAAACAAAAHRPPRPTAATTPSTRRTPSSPSRSRTSAPRPTAAASTRRKARCSSTAPPRPASVEITHRHGLGQHRRGAVRRATCAARTSSTWPSTRPPGSSATSSASPATRSPRSPARSRCWARRSPVTLKATHFNCYLNPMFKREVCGGDFETTHPAQPVGRGLRPAGGGARQRAPAGAGRGRSSSKACDAAASRDEASPPCCWPWRPRAPARSPPVYVLDPAHSFVHFEVLHFGTSTSRGRFGPSAGVVTLDRAAGRGEVGLRIATASVDTGLPVFNARLRQADLLASAEYPEAYFVAAQLPLRGPAPGRGARRVHAARREPAVEPATHAASPAAATPAPKSAAATSRARSCAATSAPPTACPSSPTACGCWCRSRAGVH